MRKLILATSALMPLCAAGALANPQGGQVVGGAAAIQGQGTSTVTVTQSSDRAIVNWTTFNVGAGETTRFIQPGASSVILNRVTGGLGPSTIYGSVLANGRVFLVNPDGVLIGRDAVIDTAGFLATTSDIKNADFLGGRYQFYTPGNAGASVVNLGTITAQSGGFAALVAPGVRNSGTITATLGSVGLASANGFTLDFYGDKLITLQVGDAVATQVRDVATGQALDTLVRNDGKIRAAGGRVELSAVAARTIVDSVINNTGVIEANTFTSKNGTITLSAATADVKGDGAPVQTVKVSGRISAQGKRSGQQGGTVTITGEDIRLANARVNVSGRAGGGVALIGGDIGGGRGNPLATASLQPGRVPTASTVTVDSASTIDASARTTGNGGKVVVWADGTTSFQGSIRARGGAQSGDGGFVEVSGKQWLGFRGTVDTGAANGKRGMLLLDPQDVVIGGSGEWDVSIAALESALMSGNVAIVTGATGTGNGDITIAQSFQWGTNSTLVIGAFGNVTINAGVTITNSAGGTLNIAAGVDTTTTPAWTPTGIGMIDLQGSIDFSVGNGRVNFAYNPTSGNFSTPDTFSNVLTSSASNFNAYMWVTNVDALQSVGQNANSLAGQYIVANIDASSPTVPFTPIGSAANPFTGRLIGLDNTTFGGLGGKIDGLTINSALSEVGLFGAIGDGALVSNIGLTNVSVTATAANAKVGAIAGMSSGAIYRSYATGSVTGGTSSDIGGLVGRNLPAAPMIATGIVESYADVTVTGGASSNVGGLVGSNLSAIAYSYSRGSIVAPTAAAAGGLVGENAAIGFLLETYAAGGFTAPPSGNGGLVGLNTGGSNIQKSYWDSTRTGQGASAGGQGTPLTTTALQSALPPDFDTSIWARDASISGGDPYLKWQLASPLSFAFLPTAPGAGSSSSSLPSTASLYGQQQQQAALATQSAPGSGSQSANSVLPDTSPDGGGSVTGSVVTNPAGTATATNTADPVVTGSVNPAGAAGTAGSSAAPVPRTVVGPNGERFSSVPPIGETRFITNEVVLQVNIGITPEQIATLAREHGITVLASQTLGTQGQLSYRMQLPLGRTVRDAIAALEANSIVSIAQPNYVFGLSQTMPSPASLGVTRGADPAQYSARKMNLQAAHKLSSGNNVLVAVIDSAIDLDHPGLRGSVVARLDAAGRDDPPHAHGTAMAGAIVEHGQLLGIAPSAKLLAARAFSQSSSTAAGTSFAIVQSIDWAVAQGARVINMSFAGPRDPALERAIKSAYDKGVVLVAAAGNAGPKAAPMYPGADPNVIAVTAIDAADRLFRGANQGNYVAIAAPGVDVISSAPDASYQMSTGTSIATAHVSGVAALLLARDPGLTPAAVHDLLTSTATDLGARGRDNQYGWGMVDPPRALMAIKTRSAAVPVPAPARTASR